MFARSEDEEEDFSNGSPVCSMKVQKTVLCPLPSEDRLCSGTAANQDVRCVFSLTLRSQRSKSRVEEDKCVCDD